MAEMKNICGKIPVELHEKVRAEIEEKDTSTQIFIQQVIEEHFNRLEGKGEESMEKRTLAVQVTEDLFQRVKWAVAKEGIAEEGIEGMEAAEEEPDDESFEEFAELEEEEPDSELPEDADEEDELSESEEETEEIA